MLNVPVTSEDKDDDIKGNFYKEIEQLFNQLPVYHMDILLGDFIVNLGRENISQPTIWNESVHRESNHNGFKLANFAIVNSKKFPYINIHKHIWTSPDSITQSDRSYFGR